MEVNSLYGSCFDSRLLGHKLDRLAELGFDTPKTNKIAKDLANTVTICTGTLAGAKMLTASATTQEEHHLAARATAKQKKRTLDVLPEHEHTETLYNQLLDCLPVLVVRTGTEGKVWSDTTTPLAQDRVVLRVWLEQLTMPEVHTRLNYCFKRTEQGPCGDGGGTGGDKLPTTHGHGDRHGGSAPKKSRKTSPLVHCR